MKTLRLISALVVLPVACTRSIPVADPGTGDLHPDGGNLPDVSRLLEEPDYTLALSPSLGGLRVDETGSGPWRVRSTLAARGPATTPPTGKAARRFHTRDPGPPPSEALDSPPESDLAAAEPLGRTELALEKAGAVPLELLESALAGRSVAVESEAESRGARTAPGSTGSGSDGVDLEKKDLSRAEELSDSPETEASFADSDKDVHRHAREASGGERSVTTSRAPSAPPLRAGSSDDNSDFDKYLEYLRTMSGRQDLEGRYAKIDVAGRRFVCVVDAAGRPIPGADVLVADEARDSVIAMGRSYGDGRAPFYLPADDPAPENEGGTPTATRYVIQVRHGDHHQRVSWSGDGEEVVVKMEDLTSGPDEIELDVVFLIDTTGSMADEIARIKDSLLGVTRKLRSLGKEFTLRYGAVLYRDVNDQYVTKSHPFTSDIEAFDTALKTVHATGGGDAPESLNQGLAVAIDGMSWNPDAARVVFLIADAPPHMDYPEDTSYDASLRTATARGIRVHAVAASGLDATGTLVFRQIAQYTRGKFIFIEYGRDAATSAAAHDVKGKVQSNNLDQILYEQIRDELAGWGRAS